MTRQYNLKLNEDEIEILKKALSFLNANIGAVNSELELSIDENEVKKLENKIESL